MYEISKSCDAVYVQITPLLISIKKYYETMIYWSDRNVKRQVVSASDVRPMNHWLNVWCIWHTKVETLHEFQSRHQIGWIIHYFRGDVCVAFFNVPPGKQDTVTPNERRKPSCLQTVMTRAYQDQLNAGIFKSMWNI